MWYSRNALSTPPLTHLLLLFSSLFSSPLLLLLLLSSSPLLLLASSSDEDRDEADTKSTAVNTQQIPVNDGPLFHLRPSENGIPVGEALAPPLCPSPPVTRSLGICYLKQCTDHKDCATGQACCFNSCIRTCTEPMDPPAAFDWIQDTSQILPILDIEFEESPEPFYPILIERKPPQYAAAEAEEELVHLPGGCYVSASRYAKLKEFMAAPSIEECRCDDGEVVCDVRTEKS